MILVRFEEHLRTVSSRGKKVVCVELLHLLHLPAGQLDQAAPGEVRRVGVGRGEQVSAPSYSQPGCSTLVRVSSVATGSRRRSFSGGKSALLLLLLLWLLLLHPTKATLMPLLLLLLLQSLPMPRTASPLWRVGSFPFETS